jgi:hypothetical protein
MSPQHCGRGAWHTSRVELENYAPERDYGYLPAVFSPDTEREEIECNPTVADSTTEAVVSCAEV